LIESAIALGVLALGMTLVAQASLWGLAERRLIAARQEALQIADNTLELARSQPFEDLAEPWATAQKLPSATRLIDGQLTVQVTPERRLVKRVTVSVTWSTDDNTPKRSIRLVGLIAARSTPEGAKP
jgi:type II secretory pathway pseudopilin PulG